MKQLHRLLTALIVLSSSAWALSVHAPEEILMLPDQVRNTTVTVRNTAEHSFSVKLACESNLTVYCQDTLSLPKNGTEEFVLEISSNRPGVFPVFINAGSAEGVIQVRVSGSPVTLKNIIAEFNQSLINIEARTGHSKSVAIARGILQNAVMLYEDGKYELVAEELEILDYHMDMAMRELPLELAELEAEEAASEAQNPVALGVNLIPVTFLVLLGGLVLFKIKAKELDNKKVDFTQDLIKVKSQAVVVKEDKKEVVQSG